MVDPHRDGVSNALWHHETGSPTVASNKGRFNTSESVVRADLKFARVEFRVTFPTTGEETVTDLANDIEFGLKNLALGDAHKVSLLADQSEDTFTFAVYDSAGVAIGSVPITWDTDWNATEVNFAFLWTNDRVVLFIDGEKRAEVKYDSSNTDLGEFGRYPLNPWIKVTGADNLDVTYINVDNAQSSSIMLI